VLRQNHRSIGGELTWSGANPSTVALFLGSLLALAAVFGPLDAFEHLFSTLATVLLTSAAALALYQLFRNFRQRSFTAMSSEYLEHAEVSSWLTDKGGHVLVENSSASRTFGASKHVSDFLGQKVASPSLAILRLQNRALAAGKASEAIYTAAGGTIEVSVRLVRQNYLVWRVSEKEAEATDHAAIPALSLGRNGTVLAMNDSARLFVGGRTRSVDELFPEQPLRIGAVNRLSTLRGPALALIEEGRSAAGRRELLMIPVHSTENKFDLDCLPVAAMYLGQDGSISELNSAARELLGSVGNPGAALSDAMGGLGRPLQGWLNEVRGGQAPRRPEFMKLKRTDRETFVQISLSAVRNPTEKTAIMAVMSDATDIKSLELQFVQSQKMQAIGQLAGGIAHDFNNLLTAISGHCDLLLLKHDSGDADYQDLVQINQNANRAAGLVGQLLAFSRKQTLEPQLIDLRESLSDLTHLLNRLVGENVSLVLEHEPNLAPIKADKRQIEQVFMNLVVNARDAMKGQGEICVTSENLTIKSPLHKDRVTLSPGAYVSIHVSDNGCGIAADKMPKIFEPFFTTKKTGEGAGLGLSTVYGIVKQSGGFVFVDSIVGQGTTFTLIFPAAEETAALAEIRKPNPVAILPKVCAGSILLVEDEAPVRAFASRALRASGFSVVEADSGERALEILSDAEFSTDILLSDVIMPGKDGPTWVREALSDRPTLPVVFMSGYAESNILEALEHIPNATFLQKPFSLKQLTQTVAEHLATV
jgi:two-component system cell cycle sensor histidine kinase/response regulator CckA